MYKTFVLLLLLSVSRVAISSETWYVATTVNSMIGNYSGSEQRNDLFSGTFILDIDYLDSLSFSLAYNDFSINFKDLGTGEFEIKQNTLSGKVQYHYFSDKYKGTISTQLVVHSITNNDVTLLTDNVSVYSPKISYLNLNKSLYFDLEYVNSSYPGNSNLVIQQFSPSIGFSFNDGSDWLRFKTFLIQSSDKTLSQGEDSLTSIDIKWMHWLSPDSFLSINNVFIDVLAGKRIFAVDNDAYSVYNLADVQQGSLLFGAAWRAKDDLSISAILGVEKYENTSISNSYNQQYLYLSLTKLW